MPSAAVCARQLNDAKKQFDDKTTCIVRSCRAKLQQLGAACAARASGMTDISPGDSSSPQLRQLRDALERAIISSLQLLDQLEWELSSAQTQDDIAQRKSRAAALIDVKKVCPAFL